MAPGRCSMCNGRPDIQCQAARVCERKVKGQKVGWAGWMQQQGRPSGNRLCRLMVMMCLKCFKRAQSSVLLYCCVGCVSRQQEFLCRPLSAHAGPILTPALCGPHRALSDPGACPL